MEIKQGFRKEGGLFNRVLEEPIGVYQAENRLKSNSDTRKAHSPLLVVCLQPAPSPTGGRLQRGKAQAETHRLPFCPNSETTEEHRLRVRLPESH